MLKKSLKITEKLTKQDYQIILVEGLLKENLCKILYSGNNFDALLGIKAPCFGYQGSLFLTLSMNICYHCNRQYILCCNLCCNYLYSIWPIWDHWRGKEFLRGFLGCHIDCSLSDPFFYPRYSLFCIHCCSHLCSCCYWLHLPIQLSLTIQNKVSAK